MIKHITFEYFDYYDSDNEDLHDWLRQNQISVDDYDYMLFSQCVNKKQMAVQRIMKERLLHGCCSNECYYVEDFFGKSGVLGIAYHS